MVIIKGKVVEEQGRRKVLSKGVLERNLDSLINRVIRGDVLEVLRSIPDESIDLGITSPPYNKAKYNGWLVPEVRYSLYHDDLPEDEYQGWQIEVLNELYRVTKQGGSFFYNHKVRHQDGKTLHPLTWVLKTEWTLWQEIIWDRGIAGNIRGWRFWQVEERIYWLAKGKPNRSSLWRTGCRGRAARSHGIMEV